MNAALVPIMFLMLIILFINPGQTMKKASGVWDESPEEFTEHHTSVRHIDSFNNAVVTHDPECKLCKKLNQTK